MIDINLLLERLVDRLPDRLRPYAKAIVPAGTFTATAIATDLILSGPELRQAVYLAVGGLYALFVRQVPNKA